MAAGFCSSIVQVLEEYLQLTGNGTVALAVVRGCNSNPYLNVDMTNQQLRTAMECPWLPPELDTSYILSSNQCSFSSADNISVLFLPEDEGLYEVPTGIIVLLSIFYGTISVVAVVGNSLVMWIIATSRRMHNVTHYFIANLALADIVIGLFAIPFQFQAALLQRWNLPHFMCPFCPFIQQLSVNVSVFTLTAIAVDRHRAVLKPLSARPSKLRAKIGIAGVWCVGALLASPMAAALRVSFVNETDNMGRVYQQRPFCQNIHLSDSAMMYYRFVLFSLQYATPLCIITCAYARMAHRLWGSRAPGNAEDTRDANIMRNKKKVIKMLVIVVTLFALCWLPLQTYNVMQDIFPAINSYRYINIIWFCFDWLAMSNSCYNPFIYGIYNEKFKREFQIRFPAFRSRHWTATPNNDSIDLDRTGQTTLLHTRVSLRSSQHDVHEWCRGYSSSNYWQVHQVTQKPVARKSIHQFQLTTYADGKNYFDLRDNYHRKTKSTKLKSKSQQSLDQKRQGESAEADEFGVKTKMKFSNSFCKELTVRTTVRSYSASTEELFHNDNDDSSQGASEQTSASKADDGV